MSWWKILTETTKIMNFEELLKSLKGKRIMIHYISSNEELASLQGTLKEVEKHYIRLDGDQGKHYINRATNHIEGVLVFHAQVVKKAA